MEEGVEEVPLGLYIVRGDNIVIISPFRSSPVTLTVSPDQTLIGEVDPELEKTIGKSSALQFAVFLTRQRKRRFIDDTSGTHRRNYALAFVHTMEVHL